MATGFTWNKAAARFRDVATGRFVPATAVREAIDQFADGVAGRMGSLANRLNSGAIDTVEFQAAARELLRDSHVAAAMVAAGGKGNWTPKIAGATGGRLRSEYEYLYLFTRGIDRGDYTPDQIVAYSKLYGYGVTRSFEAARRSEMIDAGYRWERRQLNSSQSCPECIEYADRGWRPIGSLPATGSQCSCRSRCRCSFIYSVANPNRAAS